MPEAWALAAAAGAPGGRGAVVAVLDSGVAYERFGRYRRAPDLRRNSFVRGYDFVDRDRHPNDVYGHGTHVAGTIVQATNNRLGVAGIAYGAKVMPLRVLDAVGDGRLRGHRPRDPLRGTPRRRRDQPQPRVRARAWCAAEIPEILAAIRYAHRRGVLIVAAAGNEYSRRVAYPARAGHVIAVGATTRNGCQSDYSNSGADLDVSPPAAAWTPPTPTTPEDLRPLPARRQRRLDLPADLPRWSVGASACRAATRARRWRAPTWPRVAALVIASGKLGANPSPGAVQHHLQAHRARPRAARASTRATAGASWIGAAPRCAARRLHAPAEPLPRYVRMIITLQGA